MCMINGLLLLSLQRRRSASRRSRLASSEQPTVRRHVILESPSLDALQGIQQLPLQLFACVQYWTNHGSGRTSHTQAGGDCNGGVR